MRTNRELAIAWWNESYIPNKHKKYLINSILNDSNRSIDSITGREIEIIFDEIQRQQLEFSEWLEANKFKL